MSVSVGWWRWWTNIYIGDGMLVQIFIIKLSSQKCISMAVSNLYVSGDILSGVRTLVSSPSLSLLSIPLYEDREIETFSLEKLWVERTKYINKHNYITTCRYFHAMEGGVTLLTLRHYMY